MYGTILDGRLRILIINLQDSMEFLCVDVDKNELDSFSLDGFWRLDDEKLRTDFFDLAQKNGLGILEKRNLQRGFDYLYRAIGLMSRLPVKTVDIVWLLPQTDRQELQNLLVESIHSFEAVKRANHALARLGKGTEKFFRPNRQALSEKYQTGK